MRTITNLGPPDSESSQKGAASDTWIIHLKAHFKCIKNTPFSTHYPTC